MTIVREARAADAAGIARVHVDSWRTTYPGIMPAEALAGLSYTQREKLWVGWLAEAAAGERVVFVAEDESEVGPNAEEPRIVGFASGGPAPGDAADFDGELYMIYLLQSHQRRGLGRELFRCVTERLAAEGRRSLFVWVARDNPSRAFYEALGGRLVRERREKLFGQSVDEVGYGWDDMAPLLERPAGAGT